MEIQTKKQKKTHNTPAVNKYNVQYIHTHFVFLSHSWEVSRK